MILSKLQYTCSQYPSINATVSLLFTQLQLSHLSVELMMAFHINIIQLYMWAGKELELLMIDTHLTGVHARPVLTVVDKNIRFLTPLPMPANELQPTEEIPLIRLQGHQFVLSVHLLLGTWLDYL